MQEQQLEPGTVFGPYTIEGFIAAGGMGQVYAGRHTVYGSPVALKVLHAVLHADPSWRRRFNEEGVIGQQLKHPHVLAARELVEHDGRVALVMDLVRGGQTLLKTVNREFATGLPLVSALQVFLGVLQGVEYAHGKGVVHGDIKPENVLVHADDFRTPDTWVPMVTDFGTFALIANPVVIDGQAAVVASPRYASPEHLHGIDKIDARSDIYCLGLLLHFLLTGRHASEARTVEEAHEHTRAPVPLVHLVDQPVSIHLLFQRATAVSPDDRYRTCREFAIAIRATLDELGVQLRLEDLQADLATEVMEERARLKAQIAAREAEEAAAEAPTELSVDEPAPVPLDGLDARVPESTMGHKTPMSGGPAAPPTAALGGFAPIAPSDDEEPTSDAPTVRYTDTAALEKLLAAEYVGTPAPAQRTRSDAGPVEDEAPAAPAAQAAALVAEAPKRAVPVWVWLAGAAAVTVILVVVVMMTNG